MAESIHESFDIPGESHLVVENIRGPITITGWDRPKTEITATPHQDGVPVEISQHDTKVIARTKAEPGQGKWLNWFGSGHSPRVDYTINVPFATDLKVRNVEGPIAVRQCTGEMRINTVDGNVTLDHAQGDISAETVNGALSASHLQGDPKLKTVNGKLAVQESVLSGLSAHTVNGKIEVDAAWHPEAQISLHTVNGDCDLTVPSDFRAQASAHGINVSVTLGQAKTVNRQFSGWHGIIGPDKDSEDEPAAKVSFHTVNGHLRIDDSGEPSGTPPQFAKQAAAEQEPSAETEAEPVQVKVSAAPAEGAPIEAKAPKSQLEVLQMVERGEMTVEEALEILES